MTEEKTNATDAQPEAEVNETVEQVNAETVSDGASEVTVESLTDQVAALEKQVTETKARANADMYNFQKRLERETDNAKKFALERFAKDLLENIDNLERAITAANNAGVAEDDALLQGVTLTHKAMLSTLEKHKVTPIAPEKGDDFNADLHEAVGMDPEAESGKIGNVLQKGYQLQDRLLRPAMVMVGQQFFQCLKASMIAGFLISASFISNRIGQM